MLVAVKWRSDFEFWPERVRKNVQILPPEFDILMTEENYLLHLSDHEEDFLEWKSAQIAANAANAANAGAAKFVQIRNKWQQIADRFAFENSVMGISQIPGKTKEVADAFDRVVYYLNVNAPTEAIRELDLIPRGEEFLTEARVTAIKNEFSQFLITL